MGVTTEETQLTGPFQLSLGELTVSTNADVPIAWAAWDLRHDSGDRALGSNPGSACS